MLEMVVVLSMFIIEGDNRRLDGNNGVCVTCKCSNCEHNALDEFWKNLNEKETEL